MAKKKQNKTTKKYGPRYGAKLKNIAAKIEAVLQKKQQCPYCKKLGVKRKSAGIWHCRKCDAKFTGRTYNIKSLTIREEKNAEL